MPNDKEIDPSSSAAEREEVGDNDEQDTPVERPVNGATREPAASPEQQAAAENRKQRRAERADRFDKQIREANEAAAAARAEAETARRENAEIRGRLQERESANPRKDPREDQITQLEADAKALLRQAATHMEKNPAEAERLIDEHNRKLRQAAVIAADQHYDKRRADESRNQPQQLPDAVKHDIMRVSAEYPFLRDNRSAQVMFSGLVETMTANGKLPDGYSTYKAAAAQVAKVLGIGGQSAPSDRQRAAYNGNAAGESDGGGNEEHEAFDPAVDRHKNALAQALANRRGTGQSGKEARQAWDKEIGKRVRRAE